MEGREETFWRRWEGGEGYVKDKGSMKVLLTKLIII